MLPPSLAGGRKATLTSPLPRVATGLTGAPGGPCGVTVLLVAAALSPTALIATTEQLSGMPAGRLPKLSGGMTPLTICEPQVAR